MNTSAYHVSVNQAEILLKNENARFVRVMKDQNMKVEYFAPKHSDNQSPHKQDELYVIISGDSEFFREDETIKCTKGDVLFVPANMDHRFMNFSDDFATWVIFYGDEKN